MDETSRSRIKLESVTNIGTAVCSQGQARRYGHITHFVLLPEVGHDFHKVTVTQQVGQFKILGCQMKDMDFFFPQIPFGLL